MIIGYADPFEAVFVLKELSKIALGATPSTRAFSRINVFQQGDDTAPTKGGFLKLSSRY